MFQQIENKEFKKNDFPPLIINIGQFSTKVGYAGENKPCVQNLTVI